MAEIKVEKKKGVPIIWILLALILLALLIWALFEWMDRDEEVATVPGVEEPLVVPPATEGMPETPLPGPGAGTAEGIPVTEILASPASYQGQTVSGEIRVAEVVSDRGFWVESEAGDRLFVLLNQVPGEVKEINAGQQVRLNNATVYTDVANLPGDLDDQARQIAQGEQAVLTVDSLAVEILEPGVTM